MWRRSLDGSYVIACVVARRKQLEVFHLGDGTRNRSCLSWGWKSTSKLFTLGLPIRSFLSWGWKRNNRTRTVPQSRVLNRRTSHVRRQAKQPYANSSTKSCPESSNIACASSKRNNRTRTVPQSRVLNRRTSHVRRSETTVREQFHKVVS